LIAVIQAELKPISKSIGIQCNRYLEETKSQSPPQRRPQPNQMSIDSNSESDDEQMHVQADSDFIPESEDEIFSDHSDDVR
jgi:hypothetical protein